MYSAQGEKKWARLFLGHHATFLHPHNIPCWINRNISCIHILQPVQEKLLLFIKNILNTSFKRIMHLITYKDTHTGFRVSPRCFSISITLLNFLNFICLKKDISSSVFLAPIKYHTIENTQHSFVEWKNGYYRRGIKKLIIESKCGHIYIAAVYLRARYWERLNSYHIQASVLSCDK